MSELKTRSLRTPPPWFMHTAWRLHRALHRLSGGRFLWTPANKRGWGALHLAAIGRKTGEDRGVIVGYLEDGDDLVVVAMNGWGEGHPSWWLNLQADPQAVVRTVREDLRPVRARVATGQERERLWQRWLAIDPTLDTLAGRRSPDTPVIVLEPHFP